MKRFWIAVGLAGLPLLFGSGAAHAQILHVTVWAPKSPVPPMPILTPSAAPAAVPASAPVVRTRPSVMPSRPGVDKAELDRRVVAFQKQRAQEGFSSAQYELALRFLKGEGVERDEATARRWLALAAQDGYSRAQRKLEELDKLQPLEPEAKPRPAKR